MKREYLKETTSVLLDELTFGIKIIIIKQMIGKNTGDQFARESLPQFLSYVGIKQRARPEKET